MLSPLAHTPLAMRHGGSQSLGPLVVGRAPRAATPLPRQQAQLTPAVSFNSLVINGARTEYQMISRTALTQCCRGKSGSGRGLLRVNPCRLQPTFRSRILPNLLGYLPRRVSTVPGALSATKRLVHPHRSAHSLDYFVDVGQKLCRRYEPKGVRGSQIDNKVKFCRLIDWQVAGASAAKNAVNVCSSTTEAIGNVWSKSDQPTAVRIVTLGIDCWDARRIRDASNRLAIIPECYTRQNH